MPTDPYCLRVLETDLDDDEAWRIEAYVSGAQAVRVLVTDASTVNIRFIGRITDSTLYDPLFRAALEFQLAWKMAVPLTGKASVQAAMAQGYVTALRQAKAVDGQESSRQDTRTVALIDVRTES